MKYYHVVDHDGYGTMHKLIKPLCEKYKNHNLIDRNLINEIIDNDEGNFIIIIHTSGGGNAKLLYSLEKFFDRKIYIFMHTSYDYQLFKKRDDLICRLALLSKDKNIKILVPSDEVKEQYIDNGIDCFTVQLGIPNIEKHKKYYEFRDDLKEYYNKIITTCSSYKDEYKYIKGIDVFDNIIHEYNLVSESIILGISNDNESDIKCKELTEDDFLNVLCHSKVYIQFSRMETYNMTAVQAKRFKIPVVLLNAEGNYSCMQGHVYNTIEETTDALVNLLNGTSYDELVEELYNDSIKRESLKQFKESLEGVEYYGNTKKSI